MKKVLIIDQDNMLSKLFEIDIPKVYFTLATDFIELKSSSGPFDLILFNIGVGHPSFNEVDLILTEINLKFPNTLLIILAWSEPFLSQKAPLAKIFSKPFKVFEVIKFVETSLNVDTKFQDRYQ